MKMMKLTSSILWAEASSFDDIMYDFAQALKEIDS